MKTIRSSILCFIALFLTAPLLRAQDLSKYRHFTLGMSLTRVLERTDQKMADVKPIHGRPAVVQELNWWPPNVPGNSFQSDSVEQILFSFYNGELYKISVTYDQNSTAGLTAEDMVKSISAKYGPPTYVALAIDSATNDRYDVTQKPVRPGRMRNIPSILSVLPSAIILGSSFTPSASMQKPSLPLWKL